MRNKYIVPVQLKWSERQTLWHFLNWNSQKNDLNVQLLHRRESHDLIATVDASHQQAGKHDARYLEERKYKR